MLKRRKTIADMKEPKDKLIPRFTTLFFDRPKATGLLWLVLTIFGIFSYTTFLGREGFPSVNVPFAIVNGTYFVNDPAKVDNDVTKPIAEIASAQEGVSLVQGQSTDNFFNVSLTYEEGIDSKSATDTLEKAVKESGKLPASAQVKYNVIYFGATGGDIEQIDATVSFFNKNGASVADTAAKAEEAAKWLNDHKPELVKSAFVKDQFETVTDEASGQTESIQRSFDRFGHRHDNETKFFNSVIIGIAKTDGADVIKFDEQLRHSLEELQRQPEFAEYAGEVSASNAPSIKESISELQRVLLEGLIAVLVVGSIVIAVRASLITVISMITVLVATLGFLFLIGYTLNVITLFALILGLALIVDDTIIMVEAIDAARRKTKDRRAAVKEATRKVSRAMVAATVTASLSFAPLIFVGGILGEFIRAIPITIIASLLISLLVALVFIPLFARFLMLGKKHMGARAEKEVAAGFEKRLAEFIAAPMLWARNSKRKLFGVGISAMIVGFGFIFAGLAISANVVFNIFPPTKDTNGVALTLNFPEGTTVEEAQAISEKADDLAAEVIGENFVHSSYYGTGGPQTASETIEIINYNKREISSPEIVKQLEDRFNNEFKEARVAVGQVDLGPPSAAFTVEIEASNRENAFKAANDIAAFMQGAELKRVNGKTAHFKNVNASSPDLYLRADGRAIVTVGASFDGTDTTTLVTLAEEAIKDKYGGEALSQYGLNQDSLNYNIGFESENQDSFKTLALAFPILLVVMYFVLALEFRSFLQPLLVFMAIPFSIFGVMLGLYLTDNAISFFSMLGFFALIGLSIKNTILLTDFANQARRSGLTPIDSAVAALEERFRPLFATSMTAVVSLIPLALSSPFWQGLAVVLIFGLLSSTFLVVTVFPYYYLGAEYLRLKVSPKHFFIWALLTVLGTIAFANIFSVGVGLLVIPLSLVLVALQSFFRRRAA